MKYIVKEDEKVVVAIMEDTRDDVIDFLFGKKNHVKYVEPSFMTIDTLTLKDQYIGVAKCNDVDIFDVEKGKKLAKTRARVKHDRDFFKGVRKYACSLREGYQDLMEKSNAKFYKALKYLDEAEREVGL